MDEIAARLYMTKGTLYYYFKDKQDLLFQSQLLIANTSINNIKEISESNLPAMEKIKKAIAIHVEYAITERAGFETMIKPEQLLNEEQLETILKLRDEYSNYFDELIKLGIKEGLFEVEDVKFSRNLILGSMHWIIHWYSTNGKLDAKEFAKKVTDNLIRLLI